MLTPTFRYFVVPLAAVVAIAALSMQGATSRSVREAGVSAIREQVVDCSAVRTGDVCVISHNDAS